MNMLGQVTDPAAQRNGRAGPRRVAILTHTGRPAAVSAANRLVEGLHQAGQTLVIVTHDARVAATADRMFAMRDGALVDETRLSGGTTGMLGGLVGLEG